MTIYQLLVLLSGAAGGTVAHFLFDRIRDSLWLLTSPTWVRFIFADKRTGALTVAVLGALISGLAAAGVSLLDHQPFSVVWQALIAFIVSQLLYILRTDVAYAPGRSFR